MDHTELPAITLMPAFTRWRLPRLRLRTSNCSILLICLPRKDERLSWPGWLPYGGWFTHISSYPSAAGRVQERESSPVKDQRSTTVPLNQPYVSMATVALISVKFCMMVHIGPGHIWGGTPGDPKSEILAI